MDACPLAGRPLFAALRALERPVELLDRLWHAATLLREHRGDGHVAACVTEGLDGLDALVTFAATGAIGRQQMQAARGWTDEEWETAAEGLTAQGWMADGRLTDHGRARRLAIEETADALAAAPWDSLGPEQTHRLDHLVAPLARVIAARGPVPYPNPVGVELGRRAMSPGERCSKQRNSVASLGSSADDRQVGS